MFFTFFLEWARKKVRKIGAIEIKKSMMAAVRSRNDSFSIEVLERLEGVSDLVAEESKYHLNCKRMLGRTIGLKEVITGLNCLVKIETLNRYNVEPYYVVKCKALNIL